MPNCDDLKLNFSYFVANDAKKNSIVEKARKKNIISYAHST